jgi:seryl-tRNA synthetase
MQTHIDIEKIRQHIDEYKQAALRKRINVDIDELLEADAQLRELRPVVDKLRAQRNAISDQVKNGLLERDVAAEQSRHFALELKQQEWKLTALERTFQKLAAFVPGLPAEDVPDGLDDKDNTLLKIAGTPRSFDFAQRDHIAIATDNDMVDFEGARTAAGTRAYALKGDGVLLEQAILRLAFDLVVERGFTPISPPLMVREAAMFGTGYFPLGEDNAYELKDENLFLTGTSEVGIMAMQAERLYEADKLPMRFVGMTTCFRREAGSAGRDVKGLYRVHQFQKVEQIVICKNDNYLSALEHEQLLKNSEDILQLLELPYRVMTVCAGDMGLGQVRKHDIETWMPSRDAYGETHSCSTFHDFQARRLNLRYREEGKKVYAHTLNNTAIASPRILIAFLENHQRVDGTIHVPEALRPYLRGRELLGAVGNGDKG